MIFCYVADYGVVQFDDSTAVEVDTILESRCLNTGEMISGHSISLMENLVHKLATPALGLVFRLSRLADSRLSGLLWFKGSFSALVTQGRMG